MSDDVCMWCKDCKYFEEEYCVLHEIMTEELDCCEEWEEDEE